MKERSIYTTRFQALAALGWKLDGKSLREALIEAAWARFQVDLATGFVTEEVEDWRGDINLEIYATDDPAWRVEIVIEEKESLKAVYLYPIYVVKVEVDGGLTDEQAIETAEDMIDPSDDLRGCGRAEFTEYTECSNDYGVADADKPGGPIRWYEPDGITPKGGAQGKESRSYVYTQTEPELWTVGFYAPDGTWHAESNHGSAVKAAGRVNYLNGGLESGDG